MFTFQSTKRCREDDSDSEGDRYLKKSRPWSIETFCNGSTDYSRASLPLRPSLIPSPPQMLPELEVMTPAQSEPSETNSPASFQDDTIQFSSPRQASMDEDMDMEMDEDDFAIIGSPLNSPMMQTFQTPMRPLKLDSTLFGRDSAGDGAGRIPTPMYPSFPASRDPLDVSGMSGMGYPSSGMAGGVGNGYLGVPSYPDLRTNPAPTSKPVRIHHDRSRRMPSPISEDDLPDTPTALTQSRLERLSVTTIAEHMDVETMDPPPGVVTTPTRGRKRSGALSGKGRFSMGYRDDCERCRQRVPGHYSHFLP